MHDFTKGHYKIYFRNDVKLYKIFKDRFEHTLSDARWLPRNAPYYIRIINGKLDGQSMGEYNVYDREETIFVESISLTDTLPDEMFQM